MSTRAGNVGQQIPFLKRLMKENISGTGVDARNVVARNWIGSSLLLLPTALFLLQI
jgi:hypothetical protein